MVRFDGCDCLIACPGCGVFSKCRKFNSKSFKKSSFSSLRLPDRVGCQFAQFSSGPVDQVPPFSSFSSVHSVQYSSSREWNTGCDKNSGTFTFGLVARDLSD